MSNEMILDPEQLVKRSSDIIASEVDGEVVMMSVDKGMYFGLDSTGRDIWNKLEQPKSINKICDELQREYNAEAEVLKSDVLAFVKELLENGIIVKASN
jgi:hypothetical protein